MLFFDCTILADKEIMEKIEKIVESWKSTEFGISFTPGKENDGIFMQIPDHWTLCGDFEELEITNLFSLPLIIEDLGGKVWKMDFMRLGEIPDKYLPYL